MKNERYWHRRLTAAVKQLQETLDDMEKDLTPVCFVVVEPDTNNESEPFDTIDAARNYVESQNIPDHIWNAEVQYVRRGSVAGDRVRFYISQRAKNNYFKGAVSD